MTEQLQADMDLFAMNFIAVDLLHCQQQSGNGKAKMLLKPRAGRRALHS